MLDLPGPRAFVERVTQDLDSGHSVVVVFPNSLILDGRADAVLDAIAALAGADLVASDGAPHLTRRIVDGLGYGPEWRPSHDPLWDLAHWTALAGLTAALRSWEHDVTPVLARWESLLHEAGRGPEQRFRLLLGVGSEQVSAAGLERTPPLFVRLHWWWGVIDRIDTDLHIRAKTLGGPADPLQHAQLLEAIAWDLPLIGRLRPEIPDFPTRLIRALPRPADGPSPGDIPATVREHDRLSLEGRSAPPPLVRSIWDRGDLDIWDGRYRPRLQSISAAGDLPTLLWRAQVRVLFPYVEEHRALLARVFQHRARESRLGTSDEDTLELGEMYALVRQGRIRLPRDEWEMLKAARDVRNDLAHGRPAAPKPLHRLLEAMPL